MCGGVDEWHEMGLNGSDGLIVVGESDGRKAARILVGANFFGIAGSFTGGGIGPLLDTAIL